ncbi:MAG: bifunctional 23S rRNA (guanine(2069)-N(7))-methyltransferase RlmK/23S rRNA (guanine(2445)-N(2))-methyltransferase RlmL [Gammaproteobacteria bacterium]
MSALSLFATCPRGVEPLLAAELQRLGAGAARERPGGVAVTADLAAAYRACLWSRLASRVLLPLQRFELADADALYAAARGVDWPALFDVGTTFAIEVAGHSPAVTHTHYAGLKVKDAIADAFRAHCGERPSVDLESPGLRVHLHLERQHATLSLDLAGDSLHRRGYRSDRVQAPLKENLAAALLVRAGWPQRAAEGQPLLDPMCGSGTLLIEGALMAADIAPGLQRPRFGFESWLGHQSALWQDLRREAETRARAGRAQLPPLYGRDLDPTALRAARRNAERAGLAEAIDWQAGDATQLEPPGERAGLLICNPPYGERLGNEADLIKLYSLFGSRLIQQFPGWRASVFTGRPDLAPRLGLRAASMHALYNGALPCKLLNFDIAPRPASAAAAPAVSGGEDFANRLQKNLRHLGKWAQRSGVSNYRLYDADLPDYAVAVDVYHTPELRLHVQEYAAPKSIDPIKAEKRLRQALTQLQSVLQVPATHLHFKVRRAQKGTAQYQRLGEQARFHPVSEHGVKLWVNLDDYLDTGLFLDHRPIRLRIQQEASGKRFLNLFCYTGTATAHAAVGGAASSVSVDLSNTYLDWAQRNLSLNGHSPLDETRRSSEHNPHRLFRADCREWLREQAEKSRPPQFDLIFCDPPTFSNSKKMEGTLDTQRDHAELIRHALRLLAPGGTLYFSTNRRGFKLDAEALAGCVAQDITAQTLDEDFKRPPPAHRCWAIRHDPAGLPVAQTPADTAAEPAPSPWGRPRSAR